jgi:hypothetical protein
MPIRVRATRLDRAVCRLDRKRLEAPANPLARFAL